MTKLEEFVSFATDLPPKRREEIEDILATIMRSNDEALRLSPEQEQDIQKRLEDPQPKYASAEDIKSVFGRTFD